MFAATDHQLGVTRNLGATDPSILELPRVQVGSISPDELVTLDAAVTGEAPDVLADLVLEPLEIVDDGAQKNVEYSCKSKQRTGWSGTTAGTIVYAGRTDDARVYQTATTLSCGG